MSNYDTFLKECKDALGGEDTVWILVSNYVNDKDKNLNVLDEASNFTDSMIEGLIMISDEYPRPN